MKRIPLLLVLLAACGGDPAPAFSPLTVDGRHLRDPQGRVVLLRGVNARVAGVFDVTFDDGRTALEPIPELTAADCARMRQLGFNHLRLPINWSGIEPQRDVIDEAYLARVDAAVDCAGDAGLYVIVDLHQDAYSKEIGEDGAPLWAIVPPPEQLLEGPLTDLDARRLSTQVRLAFDSFFDPADAAGLQSEFIDMLRLVGTRWADHPAVVGFEIFNEPDIGGEQLEPFHIAAAAALREAAPAKLVFFEPPAIRNFLDFQPLAGEPFPVAGAVYAPHIYTFIFGDQSERLTGLTREALRPSVSSAAAEATAWGTPLYIGEFGCGPDTINADLWMRWQAELHDEYLAGDAFWLWKEDSQASWGVHERVADGWQERPQVVGWVSRIHAQRIAGSPQRVAWDGQTGSFELEATGGDAPHELYIPEPSAVTFAATCNDQLVSGLTRDPATGVVQVACSGRLAVTP